MSRITSYIPEPKDEYEVENQRQILRAVDTIKTELNFSFQEDLRNEEDRKNWFFS